MDQFDAHHLVHPRAHEQKEQNPAGDTKEGGFECFCLPNGIAIIVNEFDALNIDSKVQDDGLMRNVQLVKGKIGSCFLAFKVTSKVHSRSDFPFFVLPKDLLNDCFTVQTEKVI